jgi:signal transduction histidine kinase
MKELSKEDMDSFKTESMDVIQKMSKTIDSFRNLFLPDAQRLDFCVEDAINEVIMIVTPKMEGDNIELIDTKAGRHVVSGYKNEFKQVFLNLLANAADETVKQNSDVKKIEIYTVKKRTTKR